MSRVLSVKKKMLNKFLFLASNSLPSNVRNLVQGAIAFESLARNTTYQGKKEVFSTIRQSTTCYMLLYTIYNFFTIRMVY